MSRTEVKFRIRINWSSAESARQSIWTPTPRDERDLHIQAPRCSGRRNDRIPKLLPHADEACNSDQLDPCKLGSRFEPARLRRPRLAPRPAPRRRDKTTQYGKNGRAGERGGTPPPARLLRASTAALPGSPCSSFVPSGEPNPFRPTPQPLETEDLSRKTGTPALAQRVLVLREKTLNRQQGPNGVWRGHLPSGTSVRDDARYPLPP